MCDIAHTVLKTDRLMIFDQEIMEEYRYHTTISHIVPFLYVGKFP